MTEATKTASLSEWAKRVEALWEEAEQAGISWDFQSCCCGEGLNLREVATGEEIVIY